MKRLEIDVDAVRRMHLDEKLSVLVIARQLGCSRAALYAAMAREGIPARDGSEANKVRMAREGEAGRKRLALAANAAVRGQKKLISSLVLHARTVATKAPSEIEAVFLDVMREAGLSPVPQFAVGRFNIDLALVDEKVAVEIDPGNWHATRRKRAQDAVKETALAAEGWRVVRIGGRPINRNNPRLRDVAVELVGKLKVSRVDPAS